MQKAPLDVSGRNVDTSPVLAVEFDLQTFRCKPVDVLALDLVRAGGMNVACQRRY